jgi:chromosome segregation ATPase
MWTGRQTLERMEGAISNLHRQETELDSALASASAEAERIRGERTTAFRELARIKLDEITAQRLVNNLDAAETRARRLLDDRRRAIEETATQRGQLITEVDRADTVRSQTASALEAVIADLEELRSKAEAKARTSQTWIVAKASVDKAEAVATEADKKASQSEAELTEKRKPYDDDPIFSYLWARDFGTSRYAGSGLTRVIDRIAARHIAYADARANYAMLKEITLRLREHAKVQLGIVEQHRDALNVIEGEVLVAEGIEAKERAVKEARQRLAEVEKARETLRASLQALDEKRDALVAGGEDEAYRQALQMVASSDEQDEFETLVREARRTATPADDAIVRRIGELNSRINRVDQEISETRKSAREIAERRVEVERTRDRFRGSGYDHPDAVFKNDNQLGQVLGQVLEGVVRSGVLWDLLRGGFGVKPPRGRPDFGGRPFPFPFPFPGGNEGARGGEWRRPEANGGWLPPFEFPSGGGRRRDDDDDEDRGGFSTGGRF